MVGRKEKPKVTGYDKYVDWKMFIIPVVLLGLILMMPTPSGMKDVGMEYRVGPKVVKNFITKKLFNAQSNDVEQWQLLVAQMMEKNMDMGALTKDRLLSRDLKWCKKYKIAADEKNIGKAKDYIDTQVLGIRFKQIMQSAVDLRKNELK